MQGPFAVLSRLRLLSLTKCLHGHEATANHRYEHVHMPETETLDYEYESNFRSLGVASNLSVFEFATEFCSREHAVCPLSGIKKRPLVGGFLIH